MDYDPFEIHMQLLALLRRLSASHQSIDNVVAYLVRYRDRCADDLWECVSDECQKGSLNTRINILYLLDSLLTTLLDLPPPPATSAGAPAESYPEWAARDLLKITGWVVPAEKEGLLNLLSARQILESWKMKRLLPLDVLTEALQMLDSRRALAHTHTSGSSSGTPSSGATSSKRRRKSEGFSTADTLRRMDEDRERHKRVRERLWVLPLPAAASTAMPAGAASAAAGRRLASALPPSSGTGALGGESAAGVAASLATTPQSPFTPSPASGPHVPSSTTSSGAPAAGATRGGLERAIDREFEAGWDELAAGGRSGWDALDREEVEAQNRICFPRRTPLAGGP